MCGYYIFFPTHFHDFFFQRYFFLAVRLHGAFVDSCWTNLLPVWHFMGFFFFFTSDTKHKETRNFKYLLHFLYIKKGKTWKSYRCPSTILFYNFFFNTALTCICKQTAVWDKKGCVELVGAALCLGPRGWERCHTREALTAFAVASENLVCLGALFLDVL